MHDQQHSDPKDLRRSTLTHLVHLYEKVTSTEVVDDDRRRKSVELGVRLALAGESALWKRWADELGLLFEIGAEGQQGSLGHAIAGVCAADDGLFAAPAIKLAEHLEALEEPRFALEVLEEVRSRLRGPVSEMDDLHRAWAGRLLGKLLVTRSVGGTRPVRLLAEAAGALEQHGYLITAGRSWAEAAAALRGSDDERAMRYLDRAERAFGRAGATEFERQARLHRSLLLDRTGRAAEALEVALAAASHGSGTTLALQQHALAASCRSLGFHQQAVAAAVAAEAGYLQVGDTAKAERMAQLQRGVAAEFGSAVELWFE